MTFGAVDKWRFRLPQAKPSSRPSFFPLSHPSSESVAAAPTTPTCTRYLYMDPLPTLLPSKWRLSSTRILHPNYFFFFSYKVWGKIKQAELFYFVKKIDKLLKTLSKDPFARDFLWRINLFHLFIQQPLAQSGSTLTSNKLPCSETWFSLIKKAQQSHTLFSERNCYVSVSFGLLSLFFSQFSYCRWLQECP